jgi:hypothetical protein
MPHLFKAGSFIVLFALLGGCGYKPSSQFSRQSIGQSVSTTVQISAMDPENTVIIKDAVDSAIIEVFRTSLTTKDKSDTHLTLNMSNPSYSPIQYNSNGYVVAYRMTLNLHIIKTHNAVSKSYSARGTYDFTVEPNAVVTDQQRFDAIRLSAIKAIASFVAQIAAEGARSNYNSSKKAE